MILLALQSRVVNFLESSSWEKKKKQPAHNKAQSGNCLLLAPKPDPFVTIPLKAPHLQPLLLKDGMKNICQALWCVCVLLNPDPPHLKETATHQVLFSAVLSPNSAV